jgi:hypothetical protein
MNYKHYKITLLHYYSSRALTISTTQPTHPVVCNSQPMFSSCGEFSLLGRPRKKGAGHHTKDLLGKNPP